MTTVVGWQTRPTIPLVVKAMETGNGGRQFRLDPNRIRRSASYRGALAKAGKLLRKPQRLIDLVDTASAKAAKLHRGPIQQAKDKLATLLRLVKAYAVGDYRSVSWTNLVMIVAAIIYFLSPLDLIPDFFAGLGYIDDATILSWTLRAIGDELSTFSEWEKSSGETSTIEIAED